MADRLDVLPPSPGDDALNASLGNAKLRCYFGTGDNSGLVHGSDLSHLFLGEFGDPPAGLAAANSLEPGAVGVPHLLTHGAELKILQPIIGLDTIDVVDGKPVRNGTAERLNHKPVDQEFLRIPFTPHRQRNAQVPGVTDMALELPIRLTPESDQPLHNASVAHAVGGLKPQYGTPIHG